MFLKIIMNLVLLILSVIHFTKGSIPTEALVDIINDQHSTWTAARNFEEDDGYVKKLLMHSRPRPKVTLPERRLGPVQLPGPIPRSFDARKQWPECPTISSILDQGACGACWAVAGASTFSDRVCIASGGKFKLPLSAHHLLSCCGFTCGSTTCDGGDDYRAWNYFKKHGITSGGGYNSSEGCKPYPIEPCEHHTEGDRPNCQSLPEPHVPKCTPTCTNPNYNAPLEQDVKKAKNSYKVMSDPTEIKKEIMLYGPVQAGITIYEDFQVYKSGVYRHLTGAKVGEHSVRIIGWGWERNVEYWLVANSWNTNWGENGTVKIAMGKNEAGIESAIHAGVPL